MAWLHAVGIGVVACVAACGPVVGQPAGEGDGTMDETGDDTGAADASTLGMSGADEDDADATTVEGDESCAVRRIPRSRSRC